MNSPDFWFILRSLAGDLESASSVFDILDRGVTGDPPAISAANYEAAVSLLDLFASAAAPTITSEARPDANNARGDTMRKFEKA